VSGFNNGEQGPMSEVAFWFRRDLRLQDNRGLFEALSLNQPVRLFFIFDPSILKLLEPDDHRVSFLWDHLAKMRQVLEKHGSTIEVLYGEPTDEWAKVFKRYPNIKAIYCNHDYESSAIERDQKVAKLCEQRDITFRSFKDQVIFEKNEILSDSGSVYKVYTPYKKKWLANLKPEHIKDYKIRPELLKLNEDLKKPFVTLKQMGFRQSSIKPPEIFYNPEVLKNYAQTRDFPALEKGTSKMGLSLRFGLVSPRACVRNALNIKADVWLSELIWREFFMQILFHYPHIETQCFRPEFDKIEYRLEKEELERWKSGQTGEPLVDAGMRELTATGYMHNRVRMMVASYLTKHLLHYWKEGERYFASKLFDFDLSANVGNWQWAAGCGVDAAPYFRIFNAHLQAKKFDPRWEYIKKWVPEVNTAKYPKPMVDHEYARKRALATFKKGLG
jgi:deoxyribodipyrimidine photo-lyase